MSSISSKKPFVQGVKSSTKLNQLITSTGVQAVDILLSGGLPVGTVCIFEEDAFGINSKYFVDSFAAEGAVFSHGLFVAGSSPLIKTFYEQLPGPVFSSSSSAEETSGQSHVDDVLDQETSIAWRYKNLSTIESSIDSSLKQVRYFSKKQTIDESVLKKCDLNVFTLSSEHCNWTKSLQCLTDLLNKDIYQVNGPGPKNLMRILLPHFGSPLWGSSDKLPQFLYRLKCLVRNRLAVAIVTIPSNLFSEYILARIRHYSDAYFRLESFQQSANEKNVLFKNYKGLFHILKLPTLNSLCFSVPDCLDLAFKWKREKFVIEKLHVPPDLSEMDANTVAKQPGLSCATNLSHSKLDF